MQNIHLTDLSILAPCASKNKWTKLRTLQSANALVSFQSVSDDSADLASGDKESSTQSGPKSGPRAAAAAPWWEDEEFSPQAGEKGSDQRCSIISLQLVGWSWLMSSYLKAQMCAF